MKRLSLLKIGTQKDCRSLWDRLHEQPRFRPIYPNEAVVRFLLRNYIERLKKNQKINVLDLGVGGGRHVRLLCELGFKVYGLDISMTGLKYTQEGIRKEHFDAGLTQASMKKLPFKNSSFEAVISYGVFNYGYRKEMQIAINEVHRILKNNGKAFVMLRTTNDHRFGKGKQLEPNTFILNTHETNEYGTVQHFLDENAICEYFSSFSRLGFERTETTFMQLQAVNSDWLITAQK